MSGVPEETRPPTIEDLVGLANALNARQAKYIVIGGMAVLQQGYPRYTDDLDLLYETSRENQMKIREVLAQLPDRAILEVGAEEDWAEFGTLRVNDVITIDLMPAACGVDYAAAQSRIEKDQLDTAFLRSKLNENKKP